MRLEYPKPVVLSIDEIRWWYSPLLPSDQSFPSSCRTTLITFIHNLASHLSKKRPADAFIDFLTNLSSLVIVFFNELSSALMVAGANHADTSNAIYRYLEGNPHCHLASLLDVEQQHTKLEAFSDDILRSFLDPSIYRCEPVKVFLRQVLAGLVLEMTVKSCSQPEFINGWIIYLLEEADSEIIDIIDAGVGGSSVGSATTKSDDHLKGREPVRVDANQEATKGQAHVEHKRTVSRAEDAMEEAMQEAKRLTELIIAEEAKRNHDKDGETSGPGRQVEDINSSSATTPSGPTPNSSASDLAVSTPSLGDRASTLPLPSTEPSTISSFTTFDQLLPTKQPTALDENSANAAPAIPSLTLHNATVSIFDDAQPIEKATLRAKPQTDFLIQIEPATPQHPGWMIARKYSDFETLHEVLRRISVVSGVPAFVQQHSNLPGWKNQTKAALRYELERYIRDALTFSRLAESEGMKRFLEKDQGHGGSANGSSKGGFGFPSPAAFESMGKGMLDVLASAPKGAAGGGKAIIGGFTGVVGGLGSIGQKKQNSVSPNRQYSSPSPRPSSDLRRGDSFGPIGTDLAALRVSQDGISDPFTNPKELGVERAAIKSPSRDSSYGHNGADTAKSAHSESISQATGELVSSSPFAEDNTRDQFELRLPPPPSEISDEYSVLGMSTRSPTTSMTTPPVEFPPAHNATAKSSSPHMEVPERPHIPIKAAKAQPLSEAETRVAVELFFALINELYTLSSAWNIRRTLLNAAKSYLLRPNNPSLVSIQQLLQSSIDVNTSDEGIAAHLQKVRENSLPTGEELKKWPSPPDEDEKEKLRQKARKLLVEKGMPAALRSVMGAAASGEALGRVFDSLQVESVARGFMFAIVLQGIKAIVH